MSVATAPLRRFNLISHWLHLFHLSPLFSTPFVLRMTSVNRPAPNAPEVLLRKSFFHLICVFFHQRPPVRRDLKPDSVQSQRSTESGGGPTTQSFAELDKTRFLISSFSALSPTILASSPGGAKRSGQQKPGTPQNVPMQAAGFQGSSQKPAPHFQQSHNHGIQQGPRMVPYQAGGQGSPKSRPFVPLQPR